MYDHNWYYVASTVDRDMLSNFRINIYTSRSISPPETIFLYKGKDILYMEVLHETGLHNM